MKHVAASVLCATVVARPLAASSTSVDAFWAGANLPWNSFGYDVGGGAFDRLWFDTAMGKLKSTGINSVRFWLHADGRATPTFDADGKVSSPGGPSTLSDLKDLVQLALKHELVLQICLWSFDMCKQDIAGAKMHADLITEPAKTQSYVEHALKPMLSVLADASNVVIEVQNEPEWCMEGSCQTEECVSVQAMQRFTAMIAEAVHAHAPSLTVTTGSASLKWSTTLSGGGQAHYWTDDALRSAYPEGGPGAVLDFYNVHYYDWMYDPSWGYDPCRVPLAHWGITDKPTVVGELPASSKHYSSSEMLACASLNGYAGDLFWALNDPSFPLEPALPALANFTSAQPERTAYASLVAWLRERRAPARVHGADAALVSSERAAWRATPQAVRSTLSAANRSIANAYDKDFSRRSFLATMQRTYSTARQQPLL